MPVARYYISIIETQEMTMTNELNTLDAVLAFLNENADALLIKDTRAGARNHRWFVMTADGRLTRCTKRAENLAYGGKKARVKFVGRTGPGNFFVSYRPC